MILNYRLDNGLTVLHEKLEGVASVSVGLWIKSGSRDETGPEHGYAHFIEHMLFKGTTDHDAREIARMIDRVGGQHNAATNREYTCYYINVVSDYLDLAIGLLAEMYYSSLFSPEDLAKEKHVIMEEISMYEDNPDEYVQDIFMECMYGDHPLGRSILGTAESISSAGRDDLLGYYDRNYCNPHALIAVAGSVTGDMVRKSVETHFGRARGGQAPVRPVSDAPRRKPGRHVHRDLEQVHFCLGTEGIRRADEDRWPQYVMSTILGGNMSSRLFQNIREKEGIAYSIYSFHSSHCDSGIYGIYCATSPEKYRRALELILRECRALVRNGVTHEELQDAKDFIKGNLALNLESVEVRMGQLAKNELSFNRHYTYEDMTAQINAVCMDDFNRICSRIFRDVRLSLVSVGAVEDGIFSDADLTV